MPRAATQVRQSRTWRSPAHSRLHEPCARLPAEKRRCTIRLPAGPGPSPPAGIMPSARALSPAEERSSQFQVERPFLENALGPSGLRRVGFLVVGSSCDSPPMLEASLVPPIHSSHRTTSPLQRGCVPASGERREGVGGGCKASEAMMACAGEGACSATGKVHHLPEAGCPLPRIPGPPRGARLPGKVPQVTCSQKSCENAPTNGSCGWGARS